MSTFRNTIIYSFVFFLTFVQQIYSQNHDLNHRKYWFYRTRFINDFVKLGTNQGESIAFAQRNIGSQTSTEAKVGFDQIDQMNMYLAALALEYKILTRNNQDTKETIKEIFNIIESYNRLDMEADQFWNTSYQPSNSNTSQIIPKYVNDLNGFILREDMYKNFVNQNLNHYNYSLNEYNANPNTPVSFTGLPPVYSLDFDNPFSDNTYFTYNSTNVDDPKTTDDLSLVHDKYYSMFFAFMFINKYLPDNLGYIDDNNQLQTFSDSEWKIKQEVRNITNRCHNWLKSSLFGGNSIDWVLEFPDGSDYPPANGSTFFFRQPLVNTICHINNNYPWNYPCLGYSDPISIADGPYVAISNFAVNEDNGVFLAYNHTNSNVFPGPTPLWLKMQQNTSAWNLEWADLARKVLHQTGLLTKQKSVYENPINDAPCKGPYNFSINNIFDRPSCEWSATDRMEHPSRRSAGCSVQTGCNNNISNIVFRGFYPGVDYMLLHNLYYEYLNQKDDVSNSESGAYTYAYNLMDNYDEMTWPFSFTTGQGINSKSWLYGVNSETTVIGSPPYTPGNPATKYFSPGKIKLFQNLTSRAQIYGSASPNAPTNTLQARVDYRAGKDITLLPESVSQPGFEVKLGAEFHARIKRYVCGDEDYTNGMRQAENGNEPMSNDYESDDMNTEIPIHHVDYPELSDADKYPVIDEQENYGSNEIMPEQTITKSNEEFLINQNNSQNGLDSYSLENSKRFEVLPNPNNGVFKIIVNKISSDEIIAIIILDMKGNIVFTNQNFTTREMDLSNYAKGIYMIQINSNKGYKSSKRINIVE